MFNNKKEIGDEKLLWMHVRQRLLECCDKAKIYIYEPNSLSSANLPPPVLNMFQQRRFHFSGVFLVYDYLLSYFMGEYVSYKSEKYAKWRFCVTLIEI